MTDDSYVFEGPPEAPAPRDNNPPLSISELSFALKRTLEDRFGHVRLRGEISKVNRHASGHVYLTLKDDKSALDGVIWKGQVRGLSVQPETGLEVIVTGKITSYPARSSYQMVIESMEAAGAGALLAQLERLKVKLRDEGLFEASRKRPLPAYPAVIGVVTSPTGAVIRDILHRMAERWPCRVIVWPCVVQGEVAARQVAAAVRGFDALRPDSPIPRPDLIIVARGGGSVEDLWAFNDETLARTVAAARIPIISAVGHETDTTLIDFVSDRRAPTPTGAAEMATPVLAELRAWLAEAQGRLSRAGGRLIEDRRTRLRAAARGLPTRPSDLTALAQQRLDHASSRLVSGLRENTAKHERRMIGATGRFGRRLLDQITSKAEQDLQRASSHLVAGLRRNTATHEMKLLATSRRLDLRLMDQTRQRLSNRLDAADARFAPLAQRRLDQDRARLASLARALASLDPKRPKPGFARIDDAQGRMIASAADLAPGQPVSLVFPDGARGARIDGGEPAPTLPPGSAPARSRPKPPPLDQGDLF